MSSVYVLGAHAVLQVGAWALTVVAHPWASDACKVLKKHNFSLKLSGVSFSCNRSLGSPGHCKVPCVVWQCTVCKCVHFDLFCVMSLPLIRDDSKTTKIAKPQQINHHFQVPQSKGHSKGHTSAHCAQLRHGSVSRPAVCLIPTEEYTVH